MDTLRRFVFPVIWMLILGVIALALAKMAFFPADADAAAEDPLTPTADFDQYATVTVEPGDLSSDLVLAAVVQPDEGTVLPATTAGEITKIWRAEGDHVDKGERVLQVRYPVEPEIPEAPAGGAADTTGTDQGGEEIPDPAPVPDPAETEYRYVNLVSTAAGTVTGMSVAEWDSLAKGDIVATISPGTFSIIADLTPEQQLSLLDLEVEATVALPNVPEPAPCVSPAITEDRTARTPEKPQQPQQPQPGEDDPFGEDPDTSGGSGASSAQLGCPVPEGARVVPGLSVEMTVDRGTRTDVLTVPTTAVTGEDSVGTVYALDETTGEPSAIDVALGLRGDGLVEVTEGLTAGQEILEFAPGVDAADDMWNVEMEEVEGW